MGGPPHVSGPPQLPTLMSWFNLISDLDTRAAHLLSNGLTRNSRRAYSQGVQKFLEFCDLYKISPYIISESSIIRFITHLSSITNSTSTIRVYLSALRAWYLSQGMDPGSFYSPRVKWMIKAVDRQAEPPSRVKPFTYSLFTLIAPIVPHTPHNLICFTAMLVGYFGCLRSSEYLSEPGASRPLLPAHVQIVESSPPYLSIKVQSSKTASNGFHVVIGCTSSSICAVCWLRAMLLDRSLPPPPSPILIF